MVMVPCDKQNLEAGVMQDEKLVTSMLKYESDSYNAIKFLESACLLA